MKRICVLLIVICLAALDANAQTVTGSGTTNTIPKFTGSTSIGDSPIAEFNGNLGIGIPNPASTLHGLNTSNSFDQFGFQPYAIYGVLSNSTIGFSAAIRGDSLATDGNGSGVIGLTTSTGGGGVIGVSNAISGFASGVAGFSDSSQGRGVFGVNTVTTGNGGAGVRGFASATTGPVWGVIGSVQSSPVNTDAVGIQASVFNVFRAFSQTCLSPPFNLMFTPLAGTAGLFGVGTGGNILVGLTGNPGIAVFRVDSNGTVHANGGFRPFGADFAESVAVKGSAEHYAPGDLLVIDPSGERRLSLSQAPYSTLVAGIYSTQPGVVASTHRVDEALPNNEVPLAVVGIVPCKVTSENGPVVAGDLLVTSSTSGYAMKGTDRGRMLGAVVGKALQPLEKGTGIIQVLVTLQ